uniref:PAP2_C domain-containing protein n=1 Tax=Rhabditophanes sp. KR3021 TaxID=114890 RepID=A0AC35UAH8_9BILA
MSTLVSEAEDTSRSLVSTASTSLSIQIEEDDNSTDAFIKPENNIPQEMWKGVLAFALCAFCAFLNTLMLSIIHDYMPSYGPLPDISFTLSKYTPSLLYYNELIMVILTGTALIICIFHKYRWVLVRRLFIIAALLYFGRLFTLFMTQLPKADIYYQCAPKFTDANRTIKGVFLRAIEVFFAGGLQVKAEGNLCGDYLYSGHTITLVLTALFINEYAPKRLKHIHFLTWSLALLGMAFLLISRGHYTIDVVISYWLTTRIFWEYHTFASNPILMRDTSAHNHFQKYGWIFVCQSMEKNCKTPVPNV